MVSAWEVIEQPMEALVQSIQAAALKSHGFSDTSKQRIALGLRRAARLPVLAALQTHYNQPTLLITDRADHTLTLLDELAIWAPKTERLYFPEPNPLFYERSEWGESTRRDRLLAITTLASYHIPSISKPESAPILVCSARAVMTRTIPRREFLTATRTLKPGQVIPPGELSRILVQLGYEPVNTVISPGRFARRGGLLDIWPPADQQPTRIEYFGDEIDGLRNFDPATQRTIGASVRLLVTPAKEFLYDENNSLPLDEPSEQHIPLLHPTPATILDYLPRKAIVMIDSWQAISDSISEIEEQALNLRHDNIDEGILTPDTPVPYLTFSELEDSMHHLTTIELGNGLSSEDDRPDYFPHNSVSEFNGSADINDDPKFLPSIAEQFSGGRRFGGKLKLFIEQLIDEYLAGDKVYVVSRQSSRLQALWTEQKRHLLPDNGSTLSTVEPQFIQGSLAEGWHFSPAWQGNQHLYTDGEIFGWRRPEPRQRHRPVAEAPEAHYTDLQPGDYVVHVDYGIGCFTGLVNRTIDTIEREYMRVEYADVAQLYVPVHQADRISRYLGPDGRNPKLSRLGGTGWRNVKTHVKEAVQEVAEELLELYAHRSVVNGFGFSPDTHWQQELEASFPYIETEDQIRVLLEVKSDMETPRPMDRLICGDVGYGKTEVALRAAFKAVMDGKQVAILVPTTVLAQQHYETFRERLAAYPVVVEMLSRFRTIQQQKEILSRLAAGSVDIVIGTHRLLSSDVDFKDLGLLIIDEEQRFGVTHKETLKKMRTEVDVLTMTATPIPRTLYMTLTGVRDISTINTPPEERLPIVTHVGPYSPRMVRQAILREHERGGQVFFVHNRVQTINGMKQHLWKLVPEVQIAVAHGQMPENQLSDVMKEFTAGEVDVLLSTSIIESGLDIPNANTLIVDRADTFGLAQLYQLRGRVGRGAQRAYTYFFRHPRRMPSQEGRQRLDTLAENTQLGAGFSIAMRDLEIRGAGDLIGTRQHGNIAAVGFHLYTRLLADAVRRIRGDSPQAKIVPIAQMSTELSIPVNVDLPIPTGIPASYVADTNMRLHLYRRLAEIHTIVEVQALSAEFEDRFGTLPLELNNLIYQLNVKINAHKVGLASISNENGQLVFRFPFDQVPNGLPNLSPNVRVGKTALWMPYRHLENWRDEILRVIEKLSAYQTNQHPVKAD